MDLQYSEQEVALNAFCLLLWSPSLHLTKHLEVTWVYPCGKEIDILKNYGK